MRERDTEGFTFLRKEIEIMEKRDSHESFLTPKNGCTNNCKEMCSKLPVVNCQLKPLSLSIKEVEWERMNKEDDPG